MAVRCFEPVSASAFISLSTIILSIFIPILASSSSSSYFLSPAIPPASLATLSLCLAAVCYCLWFYMGVFPCVSIDIGQLARIYFS